MNKLNPAVVFAVLAVLFGVLNILLWYIVWKSRDSSSSSAEDKPNISQELKEIKNKMDSFSKNRTKMEDQLWGVVDKLKEMDSSINQIKKGLSERLGVSEENEEN
ncbi:hypothetical protein ACFLUV_07230 [Elusimicrobiota bacterium]